MKKERPPDPPRDLLAEVLSAVNAVYRGEIAEVKIVRTRRGIDVLRMTKRQYELRQ